MLFFNRKYKDGMPDYAEQKAEVERITNELIADMPGIDPTACERIAIEMVGSWLRGANFALGVAGELRPTVYI